MSRTREIKKLPVGAILWFSMGNGIAEVVNFLYPLMGQSLFLYDSRLFSLYEEIS